MTTRLLIGDVRQRMAELSDHSFDLIVTSPPFLALRSYLPDGHPDKAKEIGSEPTPAAYLDVLLALTAEWRRLLAPHGSIAIELGDTYAGSGGAGGDYGEDGWREGQPQWKQQPGTKTGGRRNKPLDAAMGLIGTTSGERAKANPTGWPLDKSLTGIPTLYTWSLAYGRNLLTGQPSPAGQWRIRNLRPWIRSNPPVGALGDKVRPATSYITVACTSASRWHDLDAVRTPLSEPGAVKRKTKNHSAANPRTGWESDGNADGEIIQNSGGAPPLDWIHTVDLIIDNVIDQRAGKMNGGRGPRVGQSSAHSNYQGDKDQPDREREPGSSTVGARGVHIRRALEAAGILTTLDAIDCSPKGYSGSHYAVFPKELVRQLIDEMCPMRVCAVCGVPSRRITETTNALGVAAGRRSWREGGTDGVGAGHVGDITVKVSSAPTAERVTLGWSDCGHDAWRPGRVLDPFVGSGTTLMVCSGLGRDSVGIDLDERSADLARERCGMFLEVDYPDREVPA